MDEKEKLYNALVERNLYSKSFEEFDKQFSSPEKIGKLHSTLKERELVSIPADSFQNKYFGNIGEPEPEPEPTPTLTPQPDTEPQDTEAPEEQNVMNGFQATGSGFSGIAGQVGEFINSTLRSAASGVGQGIESLGTLSDQLRERTGGASDLGFRAQFGEGEGSDRSILTNIGQEVEKTAQELFPDDPEVQNNFVNTVVPQALGSTLGFAASGYVGGAPLAAINGGFQLGQTAFEEAKANGATDDAAMTAFLTNVPLGGLEAIPISRLFSRFNKATDGTLIQVLKEGAVGGVEEALQEGAQQYFSNVLASNIYDESRDLLSGIGEGGSAGFAVGFMLNAMGAKVRDIRNSGDLSAEEQAQVEKTEALIQEKQQEIVEQQEQNPEGTQEVQSEFKESISVTEQQDGEGFTEIPRSPTEQDAGAGRERGAFTTQKRKGTLNQEFKEEFQEKGERLYDPVPDATTKDIASRFVEEHGIEGAKTKVFDEQADLTLAQRVAVGQNVLQKLDEQYSELKGQDEAKAQVKLDEQIDFANRIYKFGTELGRAVRAFAYHSQLSPDSFVRIYERQIEEANKQKGTITEALSSREKTEFNEEIAEEIRKRAAKAKNKPEGFQREEAILDVMDFIAKQTPTSKTDIGISLAYANLLSGHETQIVNFGSTALNTILETATMVTFQPSLAPDAFMGLFRGFGKGIREAKNIVKTGKITGSRRTTKLDDIPNTLEQVQFSSFAKPLNAWKYVRRVMAANDVMFFKAGEEARARMLAKSMAKKEGITDEAEIRSRVEEVLGTSEQKTEQFRNQALKEGLTPDMDQAMEMAREEGLSGSAARSRAKKITNDFSRRVDELAEQQRAAEIQEEATEFGLRSTFNNKPHGVLGSFAEALNKITGKYPALKTIVPFTNVVSNVTNRMIDYTPFGWTRLVRWTQNSGNPKFRSDDWNQQAAKSVLGAMGIGTVALINGIGMGDDEEDPFIAFTGRGPDNFRDRFQLQETGWKPYSLKVGDTYFSYKESPTALGVGLVANYTDAIKYGDLSEESALQRATYILNAAPQTIMNQSFLTGLQDLFTSLSQENIIQDDNILSGAIGKVRAFAIPNAVKQIDRIFDPKVYTDDDITEALVRDIPVVRSLKSKPIINVLGEPIRNDLTFEERALHRFLSIRDSDPIWRTIVEKRAFISHPTAGQVKITGKEGKRRSMTPEEHYEYLRQSGQKIKQTLKANLPRIQRMNQEQANKFVGKIVRNHRGQARNRIERAVRLGRSFD